MSESDQTQKSAKPKPTKDEGLGFLVAFLASLLGGWVLVSWFFGEQKKDKPAAQTTEYTEAELEAERLRLETVRMQKVEAELAAKRATEATRQQQLEALREQQTRAERSGLWNVARKNARELAKFGASELEVSKQLERIDQFEAEEKERMQKVQHFLAKAQVLDNGEFSKEALDFVDEALKVDPQHKVAQELKAKLLSYPQIIRVPQQYTSLDEAYGQLYENGIIELGEGEFYTAMLLDKAVTIRGQGVEKTKILAQTTTCPAFHIKAQGLCKLEQLSIENEEVDTPPRQRYSMLRVESNLALDHVVVKGSVGHGVTILNGICKITNTQITEHIWDGIYLSGAAAKLYLGQSEVVRCGDHGIDVLQAGHVQLFDVELKENRGSGLLLSGAQAMAKLEQVRCLRNKQSGLVMQEGSKAQMKRVMASENKLSGMVIQGKGTQASCEMLVSTSNGEAGYILDPDSLVSGFNSASQENNKSGGVIRKNYPEEKKPSAEEQAASGRAKKDLPMGAPAGE